MENGVNSLIFNLGGDDSDDSNDDDEHSVTSDDKSLATPLE